MTRALCELFDRCKTEEFPSGLAEGEVTSLAVSHDRSAMQCHVRFLKPVRQDVLDQLTRKIAKAYQLTRLNIAPRYEMSALTEDYIGNLRENLEFEHPSAKGLLDRKSVV